MNISTKTLSALLCMFLFFANIISGYSNPKENNTTIVEENCSHSISNLPMDGFICSQANGSIISMESERMYFLPDENIVVSYLIASDKNVIDYTYSQSGFNVISINIDENNHSRIIIELSCVSNMSEYTFDISFSLENDENATATLYAFRNEYGVFISPFSMDSAFEKYCKYAVQNSILTEEQAVKLFLDSCKGSVEESVTIEYASSNISEINTMSTETNTVIYCGYLKWRGDNNVNYPLRKVKVEIYSKEGNSSTLLGTQNTNNDGYFEFIIPSETDTFVRIYAGDSNAMVKSGDLETSYYYDSELRYGKPAGTTATLHTTFCMDNDLGRAFQISQAILTARDYAEAMMGEMPPNVEIWYPYNNLCCYLDEDNVIHITGIERKNDRVPHSYASWDVIMHEYGHHIQHQLGITNSPGGKHVFYNNLCDDLDNKNNGIHLAWSEAWPTVFGMQAQEYWSTCLQDIPFINDGTYDASNFSHPYPIETQDDSNYSLNNKGDGCEASIIAVLWDLYDNHHEINDTIALGHIKYWEVTTSNSSKTFSDFINYFYEQYPEYIYDIGHNLSLYGMASTKPLISNASVVSQTVPPVFTWAAQGGSDKYYNKNFVLIFYGKFDREIFRTASISSTTYTLTQSDWNTILSACGETYTVAVSSMQTDWPATGAYISQRSDFFTKPPLDFDPHSYTHSYRQYSTNQHIAYCECGEYILQDHLIFKESTCCSLCGEPHTHDYSDHYARETSRAHRSYCACGASMLSAHVVSGSSGGALGIKLCIFCGEIVTAGQSIMSTTHLPHTENGSYIMPNGIIVLMDEDIEAYLDGTLEFIYPTDEEIE